MRSSPQQGNRCFLTSYLVPASISPQGWTQPEITSQIDPLSPQVAFGLGIFLTAMKVKLG